MHRSERSQRHEELVAILTGGCGSYARNKPIDNLDLMLSSLVAELDSIERDLTDAGQVPAPGLVWSVRSILERLRLAKDHSGDLFWERESHCADRDLMPEHGS